jgi:hypothetical protein
MKALAISSTTMEKTKLEVQLKLFQKHMEYQCENDRRIYENATLAIEKHGEVVQCLSQISMVLNIGLKVPMSNT